MSSGVFIAATSKCLSLYVPEEVASHLSGGICARARVEDGCIVMEFSGGHPVGRARGSGFTLGEYRLSGGNGGKWGSVRYSKIHGWGRRLPHFGKTEVTECRMVDSGTLLVRLPPIAHLRPGVQRTRAAAAAPAPTPSPGVSCSDLQRLVQGVNAVRRQMGDALVLSVDGDGLLHAMVEYV